MAAGRPYIAGVDPGSNIWKLTETAGSGICVQPEDGDALASAVLGFRTEPAAAQVMGRNGRDYVMRHFARAAVTNRYRMALESVVKNQSLPALPVGKASLSND
jgi:colanic acid biosynthesis glycosyl transferase WcaI